MRSVGYCRVSTREQSENTHALEQQIARVKNAGASEIFVDVESGRKDAQSHKSTRHSHHNKGVNQWEVQSSAKLI